MRDFVNLYLRIDGEDDAVLVDVLIESAKEYIKNAVGYYDEELHLMRLAVATLCCEWYENRGYSNSNKNISDGTKKIVSSMLTQLRFKNTGE